MDDPFVVLIENLWTGASDPGGSGRVGPPLESGIYVVKKISKNFSYLLGPPLDKNRSVAPGCTLQTVNKHPSRSSSSIIS